MEGPIMTNILPSSDLRNKYKEISKYCHDTNEPVYLTNNGKGDLVVLSIEAYKELVQAELAAQINLGLKDIENGNTTPWKDVMKEIDEEFGFDKL